MYKIEDVYHFDKYDTPASRGFVAWAWVQLFFNYFLLVYFFAFLGKIGSPGVFYYGAFIFLSVFAYTELMDRNRYALFFEILKSCLGLYAIYQSGGDWFGARVNTGAWFVWITAGYFVVSAVVTTLFAEWEVRRTLG